MRGVLYLEPPPKLTFVQHVVLSPDEEQKHFDTFFEV